MLQEEDVQLLIETGYSEEEARSVVAKTLNQAVDQTHNFPKVAW